ncbi:nitrogen regulation protein NR(I) [Immundisolibacter cernigliae]|uniref:DNA-binding transcriptional regulator NtrC n=1 Tax=Immundisolibacter cernigliae TaxID=1810504 RepID=A0A1B1YRX3_9GAMM|nr:nitrogen regulation protein NR(I) [Immundisolibacter cernigliae]ANX03590.1 nitrogen regulation protein NR(I) [Immundisolibacter cernigliae]
MNRQGRVWVVDDDRSIRWVLCRALQNAGFQAIEFEDAERASAALAGDEPDAIVSDVRMPGRSGFDLLAELRERAPKVPVIITTAYPDLDSAVSAFQGGAFEHLPKPFDVDDAVDLVSRAIAQRADATPAAQDATPAPSDMIGSAPSMQEVFRAIGRLSRSSINVLITGESGTGKELIARALHRHSPRSGGPFIALNMAAINRELLESELFGHERGAFTGAQALRRGRFEQAHGGTLFLDEIGDMPAELQTRLLRVLQEGEFYRVGAHAPLQVDVRVIAATHQNLETQVQVGKFREDLLHRLNVVRIRVPPLRERREDIPGLVLYFLARAAKELHVDCKTVAPQVLERLSHFDWPGNVRQLENVCRWLTVMTPTQVVRIDDLPTEVVGAPATLDEDWQSALRRWAAGRLACGERGVMNDLTPAFERLMIGVALERTGGRRQDAAVLLGWGRNTLTRKIKELGIADD